jgi:UDPglucose 6-dehydrogenase
MKNHFIILLLLALCVQLEVTAGHANTKIAVIGVGYVGLVTGTGLADIGNSVICADIDTHKIEGLQQGIVPIYEPGLDAVIKRNMQEQRLCFTTDIAQAIRGSDVIFIAVGTPMSDDGSADLQYVYSVIDIIARNIDTYKVICTKSTVPVGTGYQLRSILLEQGIPQELFDMASNPEFLREGSAVNDFLHPDRIVVGCESEKVKNIMNTVYKKMIDTGTPILHTNIISSEAIKYASNGFLAIKISYVNEMSNLCKAYGARIYDVTKGMGLDKRIGDKFLNPGPGYGGSCFPKDCQALVYMASQQKIPMRVIQAAIDANDYQQAVAVERLVKITGPLQDKVVTVLGLAFKANTDDVRYSPSIKTIKALLEQGARVKVYDPIATKTMQAIFAPDLIEYCQSPYEAAEHSHAVLIMTEWPEFKSLDLEKLGQVMESRIIIDMRGIVQLDQAEKAGFVCDPVGI